MDLPRQLVWFCPDGTGACCPRRYDRVGGAGRVVSPDLSATGPGCGAEEFRWVGHERALASRKARQFFPHGTRRMATLSKSLSHCRLPIAGAAVSGEWAEKRTIVGIVL